MTYSVNIVRRIVIHPKGGEILTLQDIGQIRLGVEQIDLCFLETTTLAPVYISGVLAVRTLIVRLQIVSRVAGSKKQRLLFNGERMELPAKLCGSVRIAVDQCSGICDAQMGNLIIDFMNPRKLFIYFAVAGVSRSCVRRRFCSYIRIIVSYWEFVSAMLLLLYLTL